MIDYELELFDRIHAIADTIAKYGEKNFYVSFSGGKDSTVVSHLVDMAVPGNKIPRVFINTGIEYDAIVRFVKKKASKDGRFVILQPSSPIKKMLEEKGYPFKSKEHSLKLSQYKKGSRSASIMSYKAGGPYCCPKILQYQYDDSFTMKISNLCCYEMKKKPAHAWAKGRRAITGMMKEESGQRTNLQCLTPTTFNPLTKVDKEWENEFIKREKEELCELYYPPFNFERTGCKGCPYNLHLQKQLEVMRQLMPEEEKQCEIIWKPVYDEYRRLGYRLKKEEQLKLF